MPPAAPFTKWAGCQGYRAENRRSRRQSALAIPERWEAEGIPVPKLRVMEKGRRGALGIGDRILARTEERGNGWIAHPMKKLAKTSEQMMGVVEDAGNGRYWLKSIDKKARFDTALSELGNAKPGDLVLAEISGRAGQTRAKVSDVLGDPFAPRAFSLIAIHKYGIPFEMPEEAEAEAARVHELPMSLNIAKTCAICRLSPSIRVDARDFDDAIWAAPRRGNGFEAIVAIADVSYYVRPGIALDKEARKAGE